MDSLWTLNHFTVITCSSCCIGTLSQQGWGHTVSTCTFISALHTLSHNIMTSCLFWPLFSAVWSSAAHLLDRTEPPLPSDHQWSYRQFTTLLSRLIGTVYCRLGTAHMSCSFGGALTHFSSYHKMAYSESLRALCCPLFLLLTHPV